MIIILPYNFFLSHLCNIKISNLHLFTYNAISKVLVKKFWLDIKLVRLIDNWIWSGHVTYSYEIDFKESINSKRCIIGQLDILAHHFFFPIFDWTLFIFKKRWKHFHLFHIKIGSKNSFHTNCWTLFEIRINVKCLTRKTFCVRKY